MFSNLYNQSYDGVREINLKDFDVNALGKLVIAHPDYLDYQSGLYKFGLVMFYKPLCQYCNNTKTKEMWSNLAMKLGQQVPIAAVNCDERVDYNTNLMKYASVKGFPMIKYIRVDGTLETYNGPMNEKAILEFICHMTRKCSF